MMKKEFNVDENRTYLMGHSMGGAGALFLGSKHAAQWGMPDIFAFFKEHTRPAR